MTWTARNNRRIALATVALVAGSGLYGLWWRQTADRLQSETQGWIAAEAKIGAKISPTEIAIGGFPFGFSIALDNPSLYWPNGFGFTAQQVRLKAYLWNPHGFRLASTGGFALDIPPGGERPAYRVKGETIRGKVGLGDGPIMRSLTLSADSLSAARIVGEGAPARELTLSTIELQAETPETAPAGIDDPGLTATLTLYDLGAEALAGLPLGSSIGKTELRARMMGPLPASLDKAGLTAWRDAGGTLEISDIGLDWGELDLHANGTLAFDGQMQPEGAFTAKAIGIDKALDAMAAAGWVKPGPAGFAKLALGLGARQTPDGKSEVQIPLSVQQREISAGPVKLGTLPELKLD